MQLIKLVHFSFRSVVKCLDWSSWMFAIIITLTVHNFKWTIGPCNLVKYLNFAWAEDRFGSILFFFFFSFPSSSVNYPSQNNIYPQEGNDSWDKCRCQLWLVSVKSWGSHFPNCCRCQWSIEELYFSFWVNSLTATALFLLNS